MQPTVEWVFAELEALGNATVCARNAKNGASDNQFGVQLGDLRKLANKLKTNQPLALALWETKNVDAQLLSTLLMQPKNLSRDQMDAMVRSIHFSQVADWLLNYVVKNHPEKEVLRTIWMQDPNKWAGRAAWTLTAERVAKNPDGLDLPALLERLEAEMPKAAPEVQWTMNTCLANLGIHHPAHRERAIFVGERLGIYRDYPVSKGCTSPFAPIWINEMVRRQG
jgi:3-methyladenine DNA glycosylase AlkD